MLGSAALAWVLPFEVFLVAYAVLGPLHYLTQISWLHDRGFFTTGRFDWIPLALLAGVACLAVYTTKVPWSGATLTAAGAAVMMAWVPSRVVKLASVLVFAVIAVPLQSSAIVATFFVVLLTTVVHVYVFTGIFILAGSMKGRSRSGFRSFGVYLACGVGLLLAHPPAADYQIGPTTKANLQSFLTVIGAMTTLTPGKVDWDKVVAVGRFLAFAYTYHYLNWFSKTGIIGWHGMSRRRMAVIGVVYAISLGLYAYDYSIGLTALFFLSITHVFLEFPLDARTIVDVARGLVRHRGLAPPSPKARPRVGRRQERVPAH
ncbi:MAG TPA: hypothetical protein VMS64_35300 [Candidatus Methylomirabilis sp.]|nr:hypothetical protein [Candidatus Methylomirabilis sp.]